ncbi:MAG: cytochrome c [Deltaproteobacteria bacterium]|nr:cytochrome c [Deltaproteobacteria bacterium]
MKRLACVLGVLLAAGSGAAGLGAAEADAGAKAGKVYFDSIKGGNCKTCHYTNDRRLVGPGMRDVTTRHSDEWLRSWLKDPQGTWKSDHPETADLKKRTRKTRVGATSCMKQPMSDEETRNLIDFLSTLKEE